MHTDTPLPDLARELGIAGDTLRQWLKRNYPDQLRTVARHEGGKQVMVGPDAADAARRRYASGRRPDAHERTQLDSDEAIDRARPDATPQMPQELADRLAALTGRAEAAEALLAAQAREANRLRAELAATLAALRESDLARGHMSARVGAMLDAWARWRADLDRAGRVALWRRRLPPTPQVFERAPELRGPVG